MSYRRYEVDDLVVSVHNTILWVLFVGVAMGYGILVLLIPVAIGHQVSGISVWCFFHILCN